MGEPGKKNGDTRLGAVLRAHPFTERVVMAVLRRLEPYGPAPILFLALMLCVGGLGMLNSVGMSDAATIVLGVVALAGYVTYLLATRGTHQAFMRVAIQRVTEARKEGQDMRARRRESLPPPKNEQLRLELPRSNVGRRGGRNDVGR